MIGGMTNTTAPYRQSSCWYLAAGNHQAIRYQDPQNAEVQQYIIVHTGPQLPDIIVKAVVGRRPKPMLDDN